jgi:hypothetical protein
MSKLPFYINQAHVEQAAEQVLLLFGKCDDELGLRVITDPSKGSDFVLDHPEDIDGDAAPLAQDMSRAWCLAVRHVVQTIADTLRTEVYIRTNDDGMNLRAIAEHYDDKYLLKCLK